LRTTNPGIGCGNRRALTPWLTPAIPKLMKNKPLHPLPKKAGKMAIGAQIAVTQGESLLRQEKV
jgi:hypothetical protein